MASWNYFAVKKFLRVSINHEISFNSNVFENEIFFNENFSDYGIQDTLTNNSMVGLDSCMCRMGQVVLFLFPRKQEQQADSAISRN